MKRSISFRLTLALAVVSAGMFFLAGAAIYVGLYWALHNGAHEELQGKLRVLRHFVDEGARSGELAVLRHRMDDILIGHDELSVWLVAPDGSIVYGKPLLPKSRLPLRNGFFSAHATDGAALDALRAELPEAAALGISSAVVALNRAPQTRLLISMVTLIVGIGIAAIALTVLLGSAAMRRGMWPLHRLSEEASAISPTALGRRLTVDGIDWELEELTTAFNEVLDRLETAYQKVEAFNADVAHELRTPLATLISGTQLALMSARPAEQLLDTLASNLEDLEELKSLINDMMFLAQADHGAVIHEMVTADIRAEALKVVEFFDAWLSESKLSVKIVGSASAECSPALIRRAISNLLSNAIKYTAPGQSISILLQKKRSLVRLSVVNSGPPIDEVILRQMFDRFYRGDPARVRTGESHGLGLAIVRAIAQIHGGMAFAENSDTGPRVGITMLVSRDRSLNGNLEHLAGLV